MMTEIERIKDQLHRAHHGQAWHGPSLNELLADVSAEQAAAHSLADSHSIWELVTHVIAWETFVLRRLRGEALGEITEAMNFPPAVEVSETAWAVVKQKLSDGEAALQNELDGFDDARLDEKIPRKERTVYIELHGVVQHAIYHAGQIALLKKSFL